MRLCGADVPCFHRQQRYAGARRIEGAEFPDRFPGEIELVKDYAAMQSIPTGTAYAVWTGIGTIGTVVLGIYLFDEPATALRGYASTAPRRRSSSHGSA